MGDKSRKPGPRDDRPRDGETRRVGGARGAHGTRISRRVKCARCGKVDHIGVRVRDAAHAYCRACAQEVLLAYEVGVARPDPERAALSCPICQASFVPPPNLPEDVDDVLCRDCLRGFAGWQGKPGAARRGAVQSEPGGAVGIRRRARRSDDGPRPSDAAGADEAPE